LLRGERYRRSGGFVSLRARTSRKGREPRERSRRRARVPRKNGIFLNLKKKLWSWELVCAGKPFVKSFERGISLDRRRFFFRRRSLHKQIFFSLEAGGFVKILEFCDVEKG
jgi:hypothetical protein